MATPQTRYVILLRAIGPITHKLMGMGAWRDAAAKAGFEAVETLLNTGNMIAKFAGTADETEKAMDGVLATFNLPPMVKSFVVTPELLAALVAHNPFSDETNLAQTGVYFFAEGQPDFSWTDADFTPALVYHHGPVLLVDYRQGVKDSGALIRKIDKLCGVNTARNFNTIRKLSERCVALDAAD